MSSHNAEQREIEAEQSYVDTVYERLDASAKVAQSLVVEGMARGHVGNEGGLVERDAMVFQAQRRLSALNAAHDGLVFGRLSMLNGESRYIGRIGIRDADREILLIDWRAPAAAIFYQATAQEPSGVVRRRVLRCANDKVIGVEDDLLDADNAPDDLVVIGEGALLASLTRARDSTMHSVVATIQKEQDEAIRAPSRGATTIGGGPGTGKTVVALHRAAYLLYTDRRRFESGGVLVVGPSTVFMNYIERVLPSLGETSVTLRSLGEVVDGIRAARHDESVAAAAKGSSRMTGFLAKAAAAPMAGAPTEFRYFFKDDVLRLDAAQLDKLRRQLLNNAKRNRAYAQAPAVLVEALWRQVRGERALDKGRDDFVEIVTTDDRFIDFVEQWWPPVEPIEIWRMLPDVIDRLSAGHGGEGTFSRVEVAALKASWAAGEPSIQDVPLVDELRYLLGELPEVTDDDDDGPKQLMSFERRERDERVDRNRTTQSIEDDGFAHVLVDEAQDLSPMQWRMLGRRGRHASWTIVGDDAQSSWPHPQESASARKAALDGKPEHAFRLSTNYRNSAEIYELAAKVAVIGVPDPDLADAVRRTGELPQHLLVSADELVGTVRRSAREMLDRVDGTVAVVAPRASLGRLRDDLAELTSQHPDRLRVLDGLDTKGLEFDGVVVVEPDAITDEAAAGWRTLYVVLTRATQLLSTVGTTDRWSDRIG
ncbi:HelD family protein [Aeromicrobium fastidiosum]|uniref:AAA family ATPase n=1 Tax=Aeromicrobium fastidiosum TaxID=52699 RepID=A0A641AQ54_9ACTN|nr:UvrD-helicase domain-containing protein [Aeromicrobium fastidiosum]KAA1380220.1 AAA family ATPase [Aeromicrobium fastidiosum]MBP2389770.1 DNA helicase IV [Aeromicrobium fastidiosum]